MRPRNREVAARAAAATAAAWARTPAAAWARGALAAAWAEATGRAYRPPAHVLGFMGFGDFFQGEVYKKARAERLGL